MVLETLRYADEVNKAASYFRDIADAKPDEDLLDLATTLIDKKTARFHADDYHDRYVDALKELIERKRKGKTIETDDEDAKGPSRGSNVVDLMAALKRSLEKPGAANDDAIKTKAARTTKASAARKPAKDEKEAPAKRVPARKRAAG
jgi:DNA end-binding protein Ku